MNFHFLALSAIDFIPVFNRIGRTPRKLGVRNQHYSPFNNNVTLSSQKINMSGEIDKRQHVYPLEQPVVYLNASAFNALTNKEKLYTYNLSKAAWTGGLITLVQTSLESAPLFVLLHKLFSAQNPVEFREIAIKAGFSEDEVTALFIYAGGVFSNAGNYKSFGDLKFIPGLDKTRFEALLKLSPIWSKLEPIWREIEGSVYDLSPGRTCLGFPPHGCNTYLSKNCSESDNDRVKEWSKKSGLGLYNTRCFKTEEDGKLEYEIRLAASENGLLEKEVVNGVKFSLTKGDYYPLMKKVSEWLKKAEPHTANTTEAEMLDLYAKSFTTGSLQDHKDGSKLWVRDKSPAIETYIGFIETYRDPSGVRGEFEGFVAAVNKDMSAKFGTLVDNAEKYLPLLPWSKEFERDKFIRPDFTSLDILTFAGSGIPAGINIPNYDEVCVNEGFKNVSLGNVIPASYGQANTPFLEDGDKELLVKFKVKSFEVQVGLHELLGHGSGKLLKKGEDGVLNYPADLKDPISGKVVSTHYEPGDSYDRIFGPLSSPYEECRAEAVGLYLSLEPTVLEIFGFSGEDADNIVYVNWLSLVLNGLFSLELWDSKRGWLQSHSQARYVLMRVLVEAGVVTVKPIESDNLLLTLDRDTFKDAGRKAIGDFLLKLQVYKSTANISEAQELFNKYSDVSEPWLGWRSIVIAHKIPRKMFVLPNMDLNDEEVILKEYPSSHEGLIQSWVERFDDVDSLYNALMDLYRSDAKHF